MEIQHTYRISHRGIESTPFSITDLRQMWQAGQIDATTKFKRGNSNVWLDASDLRPELERASQIDTPGKSPPGQPRIYPTLRDGTAAPHIVRVTSVKIPFKEVIVLVVKFYLAALLLAAAGATGWILVLRYAR